MLALKQLHCRPRVLGEIDVITILQRRAKPFALRFLIVHDQECGRHSRACRLAKRMPPKQSASYGEQTKCLMRSDNPYIRIRGRPESQFTRLPMDLHSWRTVKSHLEK